MTPPEVLEAEVEVEPTPKPSTALVRRDLVAGMLRPVAKPADIMAVQEETRALIEQALKPERDYGTIPGTNKPTLLKPGAERINAAFACVATYEIMEKEIDHDRPVHYVKRTWVWHPSIRGQKVWSEAPGQSEGLYRYVVLCRLIHRESGVEVGQGVGSCSTMEAKYIDRPRDLENTVLKMAKKRAFVDATLTAFGLSDQFTQDVEDMDRGESTERAAAPAFSLADACPGKKHKGKTWAQVIEADPQYVTWAIDNMNTLTPDAKAALKAAMKPPTEAGPGWMLPGEVQEAMVAAVAADLLTQEQVKGINHAIEHKDEGELSDWLMYLKERLAVRVA